MKRKYIQAIFFIAIIMAFCGSAAAADINPTAVNDQNNTISVQNSSTVDTSNTSSTQNNIQDNQSDTNPTTVNDQATSTTPTTASSTQNNIQNTQSDTNPQTTQNVVTNEDPVVITFDDGFESTYTIAFPIMQQYGIKGTVYVVPSWIGAPGYLTLAELTALHNAGWTIANHSWDHADLTSLTSGDVTTDIQKAIDYLNQNGFSDGAYYLAYPYGLYNSNVEQIASGLGIKTARTVDYGIIGPDGKVYPSGTSINYLELPVIIIQAATTTASWQSQLQSSMAIDGTAILLMHDIVTGTSTDPDSITEDTFKTLIGYINQTGVKTLTISQWYHSLSDNVAPTATADLVSGIYNTVKTVTLTAADNLDTNPLIYYSIDNGLTWNNQQKTVTLTLNQGITTLMYYAMDNAANVGTTQTNTYTIDTTQPTATADLVSGIYNTVKTVTLTAADNLDTNPLIYYSIDNGLTWNNQQKTVTLTLNQGITTLMYYAMDNAANVGTTQTNTYTIDTTQPTATADLVSGIYNTVKTVTLTAADNLDTNPLIYYSIDNGLTWNNQQKTVTLTLNQGITKLMYYAMDSATNKCTTQTNTYTINTKMPVVTADLSSGIFNTLKSVTLTAADNLDTNPFIYYSTNNGITWNSQPKTVTINLNQGITKLMYYSENSASTKCPTQTNTYTIDMTKPTAAANLVSGIYKTNSVTLTAADNLDTNPLIYYSTNNGITWNKQQKTVTLKLNQGTTKLMFYSTDDAGNVGTTQTNTYTIDTIAPKVSKTSPTNRKTGISRTSYIYIKFSENFRNSTYWSKIRIKNLKTGKYLSIRKYFSGHLLKIKTSRKSAHSWYQVIIPLAAIQDNVGNKLKTTYTFKFKTRG